MIDCRAFEARPAVTSADLIARLTSEHVGEASSAGRLDKGQHGVRRVATLNLHRIVQ